jgi:hypothetical protein
MMSMCKRVFSCAGGVASLAALLRPCFTTESESMKFIHQREQLEEGDLVVIQCSQPCNIRLMNDANFRAFRNRGRHTYHGGAFIKFPAKIRVPSSGFWNITLDTVSRKAVSVTRKPQLEYSITFKRQRREGI